MTYCSLLYHTLRLHPVPLISLSISAASFTSYVRDKYLLLDILNQLTQKQETYVLFEKIVLYTDKPTTKSKSHGSRFGWICWKLGKWKVTKRWKNLVGKKLRYMKIVFLYLVDFPGTLKSKKLQNVGKNKSERLRCMNIFRFDWIC